MEKKTKKQGMGFGLTRDRLQKYQPLQIDLFKPVLKTDLILSPIR